jgi:hypothetical protein
MQFGGKEKGNPTKNCLILLCARDWIRTNPEHQLFIDNVCQICVVKSIRARVRASFAYFFTVSTCLDKYKTTSEIFNCC